MQDGGAFIAGRLGTGWESSITLTPFTWPSQIACKDDMRRKGKSKKVKKNFMNKLSNRKCEFSHQFSHSQKHLERGRWRDEAASVAYSYDDSVGHRYRAFSSLAPQAIRDDASLAIWNVPKINKNEKRNVNGNSYNIVFVVR